MADEAMTQEMLQHRKASETDSWIPRFKPKSDITDPGVISPEDVQDQNDLQMKLWPKQSPLRHTGYEPPEGYQPMFPQTQIDASPIRPYTGQTEST